jgi:hypothetical protein
MIRFCLVALITLAVVAVADPHPASPFVLGCLPATREAGLRRMAEAKLAMCIGRSHCTLQEDAACRREASVWCRERGMERDCGEGGPSGTCRP